MISKTDLSLNYIGTNMTNMFVKSFLLLLVGMGHSQIVMAHLGMGHSQIVEDVDFPIKTGRILIACYNMDYTVVNDGSVYLTLPGFEWHFDAMDPPERLMRILRYSWSEHQVSEFMDRIRICPTRAR